MKDRRERNVSGEVIPEERYEDNYVHKDKVQETHRFKSPVKGQE